MLEITIGHCYKCDLETVIDPNNGQYFWINRRDLEIESKCNWQAIFHKCKDSSRQKYRKELTPNITFQPNKIFVRNDLFEKIIKSCKATNLEFLKLKEKLGLCLYEVICDEQEFISTSEEIFKEEKIFTQHDVENKQLKEENEKLRKENENEKLETRNEKVEMTNENKQFKKNNIVKEEPKEIKSPNWFDKNKFKEILAIIDSNKFNYKNKIGEFKYIDIKDLVNNIRNNTISEIHAKKGSKYIKRNKKHAEIIKYKWGTSKQKELLNLFNDLLDTILLDLLDDYKLMSPTDDDDSDINEDNVNDINEGDEMKKF